MKVQSVAGIMPLHNYFMQKTNKQKKKKNIDLEITAVMK